MISRLINILFLLSVFSIANTQNRILNESFEDGPFNVSIPASENYINNLNYWDQDAYLGDPIVEWHTPDWWDHSQGGQISAQDGSRYIGMYEYEVISQEFTSANELENGKFYLFSCFIYLPKQYDEVNELNRYEDYSLKFYLSMIKPHYRNPLIGSFCDEGYKGLTNSLKKTIKTIELDDIINEEWVELRFIYVAPDDLQGLFDYDWLGIEEVADVEINAAPGSECKTSYLYLDNISVIEIDHCSLEDCIRTDGDVIASGPFHYNHPYGPWAVDNLDNIESAENITILNQWFIPLRYLPDVYSVNGIDNPIFWDGKSSGGTPFSQGQYIWEMDLTNECGTTTYRQSFFIDHSVTKPIPSFSAYNEISTPRPCCEDLPDIYIDYNLRTPDLVV